MSFLVGWELQVYILKRTEIQLLGHCIMEYNRISVVLSERHFQKLQKVEIPRT